MSEENICGVGGKFLLDVGELRDLVAVDLFQQEVDQKGEVALAISQRRELDHGHGQAIEEVWPEAPGDGVVTEGSIRRRDDAGIDLHRGRRSNRHDLSLLQRAQQLDLHGQWELADLVEEQGAARRKLEVAFAILERPSEGALSVAKELRLGEVSRNRAAVHGDEGSAGARTCLVNGPGHEFLASAALAFDQHRYGAEGCAFGALDGSMHLRASIHDVVEPFPAFCQSCTEALERSVPLREHCGQELCRDVERDVDHLNTALDRGFDELGRVEALRDKYPDRRHGRSARAEVEGQGRWLVRGSMKLAEGLRYGREDLSQVGRRAQGERAGFDGALRSLPQPADVPFSGTIGVRAEQPNSAKARSGRRLADGADAGFGTTLAGLEVRCAYPGEQSAR